MVSLVATTEKVSAVKKLRLAKTIAAILISIAKELRLSAASCAS
jgi:hypothetical protein